jgi:hypothetical protein
LFVTRVKKKSSNRTARVAFMGKRAGLHPEAARLVRFLKRNRLDYEFDEGSLYSVSLTSDEEHRRLEAFLRKIPTSASMKWEDGDPQPTRTLDARES